MKFTSEECGAAGPKGLQARIRCLERLKLRSPPLPDRYEVEWTVTRDWYAKNFGKLRGLKNGVSLGFNFLTEVNDVLKALREHYKGKSSFNRDGATGGDRTAFEAFVRRLRYKRPKPATVLSM